MGDLQFPVLQQTRLQGGIVMLPSATQSRMANDWLINPTRPIFRLHPADVAYRLEDDLVTSIMRLPQVRRLEGLARWPLLTTVVATDGLEPAMAPDELVPDNEPALVARTPHTWPGNLLEQSLHTAALMALLCHLVKATRQETRLGILAALCQYAETLACGDMLTLLDARRFYRPRRLDWLWEGNGRESWDKLRLSLGLPPDSKAQLTRMMWGRGKLAELLTLADMCSSTAMDVAELWRICRDYPSLWRQYGNILMRSEGKRSEYETRPHPCLIYRKVRERREHATIADVSALEEFFELRAELWRCLYRHPPNFALMALMKEVVLPVLLERGEISEGSLAHWVDKDLLMRIEAVTDLRGITENLYFLGRRPQYRAYASWEEALAREQEWVERGDALTVLYDSREFPAFDAKTDSCFTICEGRVMTYAQAYPSTAKGFASITPVSRECPVHLVIFPVEADHKIPPSLLAAWLSARQRWRERRG